MNVEESDHSSSEAISGGEETKWYVGFVGSKYKD